MIPNCPFTLRSEWTEELIWSSVCKGGSSFRVSRQSEWYAAFSLISYCQRNNLDVWPYSLVKFLREALLIFCLKADWGCKYLEVNIKTLDCVVSFPAEVSFWLFLGQAPRMSLVGVCLCFASSFTTPQSNFHLPKCCDRLLPLSLHLCVFTRCFKIPFFIFKIFKEEKKMKICEVKQTFRKIVECGQYR